MMPQAQRPAEVVRPLIWFLELKRIELPLIMAVPMMADAESNGTWHGVFAMMQRSMIMIEAVDKLTSINVRRPAEWRLLERSQPMMAPSSTASVTRRTIAPSVSCDAQGPSSDAK